jgi:hypothetical protein
MPAAQSDKMEAMSAVDREHTEREVVRAEDREIEGRHRAGLIVLAASVALAPLASIRFGFRGFVAVYAVAAVAWLVVRRARMRFAHVVAIAIVLRAMMLIPQPRLSGDVWRYLFDGRTLASGHNPYAALPDDPRVNHPELRTIYPPHAELLFALLHWLPLWRLALLAADLLTLRLLRDRGGALAYATFPPLLFEGIWSAHVEVIAALLLAVAYFRKSATAAACSVGTKVIPIAAVPSLLLHAPRRLRWSLVFALVLVAPAIPFLAAGHFMEGMRDYATRWIFNSPAYSAVFAVVDGSQLAPHLKNVWTSIKDPLHLEPLAPFVYAHLYADFLTRCILGVIALTGIALVSRREDGALHAVGILLLCSPAIHPWYWLALVPLALDSRWIYVALCAPLSYLLYDGAPQWLVWILCYGFWSAAAMPPHWWRQITLTPP